ncbi:hypothetical protein GCM10027162_68260 [Streptomyces incanus]
MASTHITFLITALPIPATGRRPGRSACGSTPVVERAVRIGTDATGRRGGGRGDVSGAVRKETLRVSRLRGRRCCPGRPAEYVGAWVSVLVCAPVGLSSSSIWKARAVPTVPLPVLWSSKE